MTYADGKELFDGNRSRLAVVPDIFPIIFSAHSILAMLLDHWNSVDIISCCVQWDFCIIRGGAAIVKQLNVMHCYPRHLVCAPPSGFSAGRLAHEGYVCILWLQPHPGSEIITGPKLLVHINIRSSCWCVKIVISKAQSCFLNSDLLIVNHHYFFFPLSYFYLLH